MPDLTKAGTYSMNNQGNLDYPIEYSSLGGTAAGGAVITAQPSRVFSLHATNSGTSVRFLQLFNTTSVPANGGTPVASYPMAAAATASPATLLLDTAHFAPSRYFSSGLAYALSSTNGTLGTASVITADHNIHLKYVAG